MSKNIITPLEKVIAFNKSYRYRWEKALGDLSEAELVGKFNKLTSGMDEESREICRRHLNIMPSMFPSPLSTHLSIRSDIGELLLTDWTKNKFEEFGLLSRKERNLDNLRVSLDLPELPLDEIISHCGLKYIGEIAKRRIKSGSVIDAGAYIGDTARVFEKIYDANLVYALEPEPNTFHMLEVAVENWNLSDKIIPLNLATSNGSGEMKIWGNGVGASSIKKYNLSDSDATIVDSISIDDLCDNYNINDLSLIKIDVEGSELETIRGAMKVIASQRPILLISIYHTAEDFFDIKPLIEVADLNYKFMVRKLTSDLMKEVVLICVRREDLD